MAAQFTNQAKLTYDNITVNSNIASGEIVDELAASKTAVLPSYNGADDSVTYVINIVNSGVTAYTGLTITDNLGQYEFTTGETATDLHPLTYIDGSILYYINGVQQTAPAVTASATFLVISGINVPAGGNATVIYEARTNSFAPLAAQSSITNTAVISGNNLTDLTVSETVNVAQTRELSITKSVSPSVVQDNGTLTYTFLIQNTGNSALTTENNAVISDVFDPVLDNITVTFNGTAWVKDTNYTYSETDGVFTTAANQLSVDAATISQNADGSWSVTPSISTLVISGTI